MLAAHLVRLCWSNEVMHVEILVSREWFADVEAAGGPPVPSVGLDP